MPGISPKLPLQQGTVDGIELNTTYEEVVKQNIKMILLTIPGERMMDPNFGVGLVRYLFELSHSGTYEEIKSKIVEQIGIYYPYVELTDLEINPHGDFQNNPNSISVRIRYYILSSSLRDTLEVVLDIPEF